MDEEKKVTPEVPVTETPQETVPVETPVVSPTPVENPQPVVETQAVPIEPVQPAEPAQPVQPVEPVQPQQPEQPVQPVAEATPVTPTVEATPVVQATPVAEPAVTNINGASVVQNTQNSGIQTSDQLGNMNSLGDVSNVGFVPTGEVIKKKAKKSTVITVIILILIILGLIGYFFVYPFIVKTYFSKPKKVYEETIKSVFKDINETITTPIHDKGIYEISASLDSNVNQLKDFSEYTYSVNLGIDPDTKAIQYGAAIKDPSGTDNSFYNYLKDGNNYQRFSDYDKLVYVGKLKDSYPSESLEDQLGRSFETIFAIRERINKDDISYLINKVRDLLLESLDDDKLYKDDSVINVDGNNLKVLAHHYTMDMDNQLRTREYMLNGILGDDKSLEIIAKISGAKKEDIVKSLEEEVKAVKAYEKKETDIDYDIVIYTYGLKNEFVGYAINTKNVGSIHYYTKGNYVELYLNSKVESLTTEEAVDSTFKAVGKKNGTIKVTVDDTDVATLTVRSLDKKKIDFDYELVDDIKGKSNGTVKIVKDTNNNRTKYDIEVSYNNNGEYIKVKGYIENDWTSEVANINTKAAVNMTDFELETRHGEFIQSLSSTPVGLLFQTESGGTDPSINDYYMQNNALDPVCYYLDNEGNFDSLELQCNNYMCTIYEDTGTRTVSCLY